MHKKQWENGASDNFHELSNTRRPAGYDGNRLAEQESRPRTEPGSKISKTKGSEATRVAGSRRLWKRGS